MPTAAFLTSLGRFFQKIQSRCQRFGSRDGALLKQFVQYAPTGIALLDNNMCYVVASKGWVKEYNLGSVEAIIGRSHYDLFPEVSERWRQVHQRGLAGATEYCEEDVFVRADGTKNWLRWEVRPWYVANDVIGGIIIFAENISERVQLEADRKRAESDLQDSEERLRLALMAANQGLYDVNVQTGDVIVNAEYATMLGYDPADFQENYDLWVARLHPDDRDRIAQIYHDYVAGKIPQYRVEFRLQTRSGEWKWILSLGRIVAWDEAGEPLRMLGTHTDISAAKRSEAECLQVQRALQTLNQELEARVEQRTAALEDNKAQLLALSCLQQAILDSADYSIISTDSAGTIQTFNAAAQEMLGYTADEVVNRATPSLFHDPQELRQRAEQLSRELGQPIEPTLELFTQQLNAGRKIEEEFTYIRKDGSRFPVLLSVTPLHGADGRMIGLLRIARDITQQKQLATQLYKGAAYLTAAQRIAHLGSWEFDLQTQTILWSEEVFHIFNRDPSLPPPTYDELLQLIHPDDRDNHDRVVQQAIEQGQSYELEFRLLPEDSPRYLLARGEVIVVGDNQPLCVVGTVLDITERKQVEAELRILSERLVLALQSGAIGTWDWDLIHEVQWDERMYEIYGLQQLGRRATYKDWIALVHPDDREKAEAFLQSALRGEGVFDLEFRITRPDGAFRFIKATALIQRGPEGNPLRMTGINYDITDRKQTELALQQLNEDLEQRVRQRTQELEQQSNLLKTILNSMGDGVLVANGDGQILLKNAAAEQILRKPLTGLPTNTPQWSQYLGLRLPSGRPCPPDQLPLLRALGGEATEQVELFFAEPGKAGNVYIEVTGRPLRDTNETLIGGVIVIRDVSDRKRADAERQRIEAQILHNSLHDALTDLPNRSFLLQRLELAMQRSKRLGQPHFALLFLDLDHFKVINDSMGHLAGDRVLELVAQKLRSLVRTTDMAARLGGDEFVLLLEYIDGLHHPVAIAERLFNELQTPLQVDGREVVINTSIGIVLGAAGYQSSEDLLRDADIALYRAKGQGRGRYAIFDEEMHTQAIQRLQLEQALRQAVERQELVLYYQPIVNLKTGHLYGFEALVRWQHPVYGFIMPDQFISIAEETGLIMQVDQWVLSTACQQLACWHRQYPLLGQLKISVNLSVKDLGRSTLLADLDQILAHTQLRGEHLTLEITESMLIENIESMVTVLEQLKSRQVQLSIDDFGTGYSSLSYLHRLPVNAFKIDRSFVFNMEANGRNTNIINTILALSNQLGLDAIAEGIESQAQFLQLRQLGCELGQGYWLSKPMSVAETDAFLQAQPLPQLAAVADLLTEKESGQG